MSEITAEQTAASEAIADGFVRARLSGEALPGFPGTLPGNLAEAYRTQEAAIGLWPDRIIGWKVGMIAPALHTRLGAGRVAGPIFARALRPAPEHAVVDFPVFDGGFAAVEAEFVLRLTADAPPDKLDWTLEEARQFPVRVFAGIETAGSPLATINELGPTVVASDFGNNAGLILGREISDGARLPLDTLTCRTFIDGDLVGSGSANSIPGGPFESFRFLLEHCARRGRPLKAGDLVSTGAATGVHDIVAGQVSQADFGQHGAIRCRAVKAEKTATEAA
jgi:2-keto-4-pentenoate hydratase